MGPARTVGPTGFRRNSKAVTIPKLLPAPLIPQQVGVFRAAGLHELAVGGDHVDSEELIDRQTVLPHQPADAAPEREARESRVGDDTRGHCQSECLCLSIEVAKQNAGLDRGRPRDGVHANSLHRREVDDDAAVAGGQSRKAVSPASDGDR